MTQPTSNHDLHDLCDWIDTLRERGDRTALVAFEKESVEEWSFDRLSCHVEQLARGLSQRDVAADDHVLLYAATRPEWVVACLATIRAGAIVVPIDVQMAPETLDRVIENSEPALVFTTNDQRGLLSELDSPPSRVAVLDASEEDDQSWLHWLADEETDLPSRDAESRAVMFYTSGTTGAPKGVPLSHRNILFQLEAIARAGLLVPEDRLLLPLPLHHVYPLVIGLLAPLRQGVPVILPYGITGPELVRAARDGKASTIVGVPRLFRALIDGIDARLRQGGRLAAAWFRAALALSSWARRKLSLRLGRVLLRPLHRRFGGRLRLVASGGSKLDPQLASKLQGLGWDVTIGYGLTETAPLLTMVPPGDPKIDSVGEPIEGVEIRIDTDIDLDLEEGSSRKGKPQEGEIVARGPGVFSGYYNLPEETEKSFTPDGWFRTGDLGYLDGDHLYVSGRVSTMIVTESGKNIQPDEVEDAYSQSPVIEEIGLLQDDSKLVALIVPDRDEIARAGSGDDLRRAVHEAVRKRSRMLPSYQRIADFRLITEPLPRTRLGKIRRGELERAYREAGEADGDLAGGKAPVAVEDMDPQDRQLLQDARVRDVWDLLADRYSDRRLTPDSHTQLDLGMDSMEWLQLSLQIRDRTSAELDEEAIGRIGTVRELLREVADAQATSGESQTDPLDDPRSFLKERHLRFLQPHGPLRRCLAWCLFVLCRCVMRVLFRVSARHADRLSRDEQVVLTPNHTSHLDAFAIAATRDVRWLLRTYWAGWTGVAFTNLFTRSFSRLAHAVPIDPEKGVLSSLAAASEILRRGDNLVWFPEGERSANGELQPLRPGIGLILERHDITVVPVHVEGAHEALPVGRFWPRLHRITVTFGEPVTAKDLDRDGAGDSPRDRITQALQKRLEELAEPR